jgi:hypothetical protein
MQRVLCDCHCSGLKLLEGSVHLQTWPCHPASNHRLLLPAEACRSQCAMLLLTFMPSPRCPTCPECPSPASHLANSSFKTLLRGPFPEAFPAPPRLGKMLPVCVFIVGPTTCSVSLAHVCVCVPHWTVHPQGKDQFLLSIFVALYPGPMLSQRMSSDVFVE